MERKFEIAFNIFMFLFGCGVGTYFAFYFHFKENNNNNNEITLPDTTYNKVTLDSIQYNINKKDSTIIEFKKKFEYEKDKAINASDSDAIKQFKELAGSN